MANSFTLDAWKNIPLCPNKKGSVSFITHAVEYNLNMDFRKFAISLNRATTRAPLTNYSTTEYLNTLRGSHLPIKQPKPTSGG